MIYQELLWISIIVCFIIDLSGIIDSIKHCIWKWLKGDVPYKDFSFKPFDCSLCMIFWIGLIYLVVIGKFTIPNIVIVCMLSFLSSTITGILRLFKDAIDILVGPHS